MNDANGASGAASSSSQSSSSGGGVFAAAATRIRRGATNEGGKSRRGIVGSVMHRGDGSHGRHAAALSPSRSTAAQGSDGDEYIDDVAAHGASTSPTSHELISSSAPAAGAERGAMSGERKDGNGGGNSGSSRKAFPFVLKPSARDVGRSHAVRRPKSRGRASGSSSTVGAVAVHIEDERIRRKAAAGGFRRAMSVRTIDERIERKRETITNLLSSSKAKSCRSIITGSTGSPFKKGSGKNVEPRETEELEETNGIDEDADRSLSPPRGGRTGTERLSADASTTPAAAAKPSGQQTLATSSNSPSSSTSLAPASPALKRRSSSPLSHSSPLLHPSTPTGAPPAVHKADESAALRGRSPSCASPPHPKNSALSTLAAGSSKSRIVAPSASLGDMLAPPLTATPSPTSKPVRPPPPTPMNSLSEITSNNLDTECLTRGEVIWEQRKRDREEADNQQRRNQREIEGDAVPVQNKTDLRSGSMAGTGKRGTSTASVTVSSSSSSSSAQTRLHPPPPSSPNKSSRPPPPPSPTPRTSLAEIMSQQETERLEIERANALIRQQERRERQLSERRRNLQREAVVDEEQALLDEKLGPDDMEYEDIPDGDNVETAEERMVRLAIEMSLREAKESGAGGADGAGAGAGAGAGDSRARGGTGVAAAVLDVDKGAANAPAVVGNGPSGRDLEMDKTDGATGVHGEGGVTGNDEELDAELKLAIALSLQYNPPPPTRPAPHSPIPPSSNISRGHSTSTANRDDTSGSLRGSPMNMSCSASTSSHPTSSPENLSRAVGGGGEVSIPRIFPPQPPLTPPPRPRPSLSSRASSNPRIDTTHLSEEEAEAIARAIQEADEAENAASLSLALKLQNEEAERYTAEAVEMRRMSTSGLNRQGQGNVRTVSRDDFRMQQTNVNHEPKGSGFDNGMVGSGGDDGALVDSEKRRLWGKDDYDEHQNHYAHSDDEEEEEIRHRADLHGDSHKGSRVGGDRGSAAAFTRQGLDAGRGGFRMNAADPSSQSWRRVDRNNIIGPNNEVRTKHDIELAGQSNAERLLAQTADEGMVLDSSTRVSDRAYNAFNQSVKKRSVEKGVARHGHGRAENMNEGETRGGAMDGSVRLQITRAVNNGLIDGCNGVVKEGKEAIVYHADGGEKSGGFDVAIKVFKRIQEFKGRGAYVDGDPRYHGLKFRDADRREQVELWAEKEYRNLIRANRAGVPVPTPLLQKENVLFMRFMGEGGWPAPQLREIEIKFGSPKWTTLYSQTLVAVRRLYHCARIVHGDLSEYNILICSSSQVENSSADVDEDDGTGLQIVLIDFGQAVERGHPAARELLRRDLSMIRAFFVKKGIKTLDVNMSEEFVIRPHEDDDVPSEDENSVNVKQEEKKADKSLNARAKDEGAEELVHTGDTERRIAPTARHLGGGDGRTPRLARSVFADDGEVITRNVVPSESGENGNAPIQSACRHAIPGWEDSKELDRLQDQLSQVDAGRGSAS